MVEWNSGLELGIKNLDHDHKKMLKCIQEISVGIEEGMTQGEIESIYDGFASLAFEHSKDEEALLQQCHCTNFDAHVQLHIVFKNSISELKNDLLQAKSKIAMQKVCIRLTDLLLNHIVEEDLPTIKNFERCGVIEKKEHHDSFLDQIIKKATNTFSVTNRILLSALIPLMGMLFLISLILWNNYSRYQELQKTSSITYLLPNINKLVHALQIERGLSSGYLTSKENRFHRALLKQRHTIDTMIAHFLDDIEAVNPTKIAAISPYLQTFWHDIDNLNDFRESVDAKKVSLNATLSYYSNVIKNIMAITSKIALFDLDREISSSITTLSTLLHYKETLGVKRARGTTIIETGRYDLDEYIAFVKLLGAQEIHLHHFGQTANSAEIKELNALLYSPTMKQIIEYEKRIKHKEFDGLDSMAWFDLMTSHIDKVKNLQERLLEKINRLIEKNLNSEIEELRWNLFITFIILIVVIFIVSVFVQSSKIELRRFIEAMKHLARGDRSLKLSTTMTQGEMAQMYEAYEVTRQKLLKGDIYTQLYFNEKESELKSKEQENLKLEEMAYRDSLTGAINRRKFEELSNIELTRSLRYRKNLSFLMLDIDHFKAVNDTYGHAVGDEVLKHFTSICLNMARSLDVIARIGGEEFVVMLPETDAQGAYIFAERFRKSIEQSSVKVDEHVLKYSVSIGISVLHVDEDTDVGDIIKRADEALYRAKESGRNRTVIFES